MRQVLDRPVRRGPATALLRGVVELVADLAEDPSQQGGDRPVGALERVDVALGGTQVAVAGKALDFADVEAGLQEVGAERVAHDVGVGPVAGPWNQSSSAYETGRYLTKPGRRERPREVRIITLDNLYYVE